MMTIVEAMQYRHSVRNYKDTPIPSEMVVLLQEQIKKCNQEGDLHIACFQQSLLEM